MEKHTQWLEAHNVNKEAAARILAAWERKKPSKNRRTMAAWQNMVRVHKARIKFCKPILDPAYSSDPNHQIFP
jgi:hypothetical protein